MGICKTYINGFFFEYDCDQNGNLQRPLEGIQYRVVKDLAYEPVDVEFFKQHIRVDYAMDDNLLSSYLKSARLELEEYSQLSFGEKTIRLLALHLPNNYRLMYGPVVEIVDGQYQLFGDIVKDAGGSQVTFLFRTGWHDNFPETIKIAICQYAAGLYSNRENIVSITSSYMDQALKTMDRYKNQYVL